MSATTPGMRHIWMDAIVQCVEQRTANVADVHAPVVQSSSVGDAADSAGQNATSLAGEISANQQTDHKTVPVSHNDATTAKCSQAGSDKTLPVSCSDSTTGKGLDKAEPGLTSVPRLQSGSMYQPSASSSDSVLHADSKSTDVCNCYFSLLITVIS